MIVSKFYKNIIIERPRFTFAILLIVLLTFGYFIKFFQLDASSDTLLLENDPDLKYLREVNKKYGSKDFLVLTYTPVSKFTVFPSPKISDGVLVKDLYSL